MGHNKEQHRRMSKREFINMIEEEYDDDVEFDVHTINFDAMDKISVLDHVDKKRINIIAQNSKCIIFSGNRFISHVDIHSESQPDIYNIRPRGVMKTILLDGLLEWIIIKNTNKCSNKALTRTNIWVILIIVNRKLITKKR